MRCFVGVSSYKTELMGIKIVCPHVDVRAHVKDIDVLLLSNEIIWLVLDNHFRKSWIDNP